MEREVIITATKGKLPFSIAKRQVLSDYTKESKTFAQVVRSEPSTSHREFKRFVHPSKNIENKPYTRVKTTIDISSDTNKRKAEDNIDQANQRRPKRREEDITKIGALTTTTIGIGEGLVPTLCSLAEQKTFQDMGNETQTEHTDTEWNGCSAPGSEEPRGWRRRDCHLL